MNDKELKHEAPDGESATKQTNVHLQGHSVEENTSSNAERLLAEQVRVVMVETSHPGNIGAAARAMKNMGLSELVLVNPKRFPDPEAEARAAGASDILANAVTVDSLPEAVKDCQQVYGASARLRSLNWPQHLPREMAQDAFARAEQGQKVAVVIGRECSGLTNVELDSCHQLVHIPTNSEFSSLNAAAALQVLVYEIRLAALQPQAVKYESEAELATAQELAYFYEHLEKVSMQIGLLNPANPRHLMRRFKRLFNRANMDKNEVAIMRGWLSATGSFSSSTDARVVGDAKDDISSSA